MNKLVRAFNLYCEGMSLRKAAFECGLHHETLRRFVKSKDKSLMNETHKKLGESICDSVVYNMRHPNKRGQHLGDY